jgi:Domain of unknown function (DUF4265)
VGVAEDKKMKEKNHTSPVRSERPLEKIIFDIEPADWHSYTSESAWGEDLGGGKFRLRNIPFAAYGYSLDDVVLAEFREGRSHVTSVCLRGGHSTYRAILFKGITLDDPRFVEGWKPLERLGCSFESSDGRILAIDVPPSADIFEVYSLFEKGENSSIWDFEEAHCGHSLEKG